MNKIEQKFKLSLLYVEDELFIRQNAIEFLSDQFLEIYEAGNGEEALEIYQQKKPDIIITDIEMPKMNGLELCQQIRKNDSKTPIIITTAFTDQKYLLCAVELNLVKYLIKPIDEDSLNKAIELCVKKLEEREDSVFKLSSNHCFDSLNQTLFQDDVNIKLTANEVEFLSLLIDKKDRIVSYSEIENYIWYGEYMSEDALKGLVKNLRKKISKDTIINHSRLGYKINIYNG